MNNEFSVWFDGRFASAHAFSEETNGRLYQLEGRYTHMIFARRLFAVRYVVDVVPFTAVGDPHTANGALVYAHGYGGSPIGAQLNFFHYRHVQPFVTAGGDFFISTGGCSALRSSSTLQRNCWRAAMAQQESSHGTGSRV